MILLVDVMKLFIIPPSIVFMISNRVRICLTVWKPGYRMREPDIASYCSPSLTHSSVAAMMYGRLITGAIN
jgi:hypothetical protein